MNPIAYYPLDADDMRKMQDVQRRGAGSYPFNLRPENVVTLNQIKAEAVREAAPQNFDTAQDITRSYRDHAYQCPVCSGEGSVDVAVDYCNYDNSAVGVQFYYIGDKGKTAEDYYRAANPAAILSLIQSHRELVEALKRIKHMDSMSYHSLESAKITAREALARAGVE